VFSLNRIRNVPGERKELKNYLYSTLGYTDNFYEVIDVPEKQIPKDLQQFCYKTLLNLNILFHPANEVITHLTMDIEVTQTFPDIRKYNAMNIIAPHLQYQQQKQQQQQQQGALNSRGSTTPISDYHYRYL
jgi:hypothetical protein